jgi:hypothetical protein
VLAIACLPPAALQAQTPIAPSDSSLFAAREAVWRDYFAASPALADELPADFVAIQAGDSLWADRARTLTGAKATAAVGTKLTSLRFPRNVVQRYGNVAIIHSRYEMTLERPGGTRTTNGQITEVFVWTGVRWIHPSWHME